MSILRYIREIMKTWSMDELERLVSCLKGVKGDSFYEEVIDVIEQEIQQRKNPE